MGNANPIPGKEYTTQEPYQPPFPVVAVFRELADNINWSTLKISSNTECSGLTYWTQKITEVNIDDQSYNTGLACSVMFDQEESVKTYFGLIKPVGRNNEKIITEIAYSEKVDLPEWAVPEIILANESGNIFNMTKFLSELPRSMPVMMNNMRTPEFKENIQSNEGCLTEIISMTKNMTKNIYPNASDTDFEEHIRTDEKEIMLGMFDRVRKISESDGNPDNILLLQDLYQMIKNNSNKNEEEKEENNQNEDETEEIAHSEEK